MNKTEILQLQRKKITKHRVFFWGGKATLFPALVLLAGVPFVLSKTEEAIGHSEALKMLFPISWKEPVCL